MLQSIDQRFLRTAFKQTRRYMEYVIMKWKQSYIAVLWNIYLLIYRVSIQYTELFMIQALSNECNYEGSTISKHVSTNSVNSGIFIASWIAFFGVSELSRFRSISFKCGLHSRFLKCFDSPESRVTNTYLKQEHIANAFYNYG